MYRSYYIIIYYTYYNNVISYILPLSPGRPTATDGRNNSNPPPHHHHHNHHPYHWSSIKTILSAAHKRLGRRVCLHYYYYHYYNSGGRENKKRLRRRRIILYLKCVLYEMTPWNPFSDRVNKIIKKKTKRNEIDKNKVDLCGAHTHCSAKRAYMCCIKSRIILLLCIR